MQKNLIPELYFGTAMWGWTVKKDVAFHLLDQFYEAGYRKVDTATNYPINKVEKDFRQAETMLEEWIAANGVKDLQIVVKVGSLNNMRTPDHLLSKSFLLMNLDFYKNKFHSNLYSLMVHWDNRDQIEEIAETVEVLEKMASEGLQAGLSGIKHPALYFSDRLPSLDYEIQAKHNLLKSDIERYKQYLQKPSIVTYGINAGGLKLTPQAYHQNSSLKARGADPDMGRKLVAHLNQLLSNLNQKDKRPDINQFNQLGIIYAYYHPLVKGILIGPSKISQLDTTIQFYQSLAQYSFEDLYHLLEKITV